MSAVFVILTVLTVGGALASILLRNLVHCSLALTVAFAGLAFFFLDLDAQFAGLVQILVYIGAVAILVVFAILLTRGSQPPADGVFDRRWPLGVTIALVLFALLGWAVVNSTSKLPNQTAVPEVTAKAIGEIMMSRYALPLEAMAVLLTVSTVGAVIVAMREKGGAK